MKPSKPYPNGATGRADLLLALAIAEHDPARQNALAAVLNFSSQAVPPPDTTQDTAAKPEPAIPDPEPTSPKQTSIQFHPYHLVAADTLATREEWQQSAPAQQQLGAMNVTDIAKAWKDACTHPQRKDSYTQPIMRPIVPWTRLWPRLRHAVARMRSSGLDIARLTQQLAQGAAISRLPRKNRFNWPNPLPVVLDFSDRLTPYWNDWHWLRHHLQQRLKKQAKCYRLHGIPQKPVQKFEKHRLNTHFTQWPLLAGGDTLLIVSDLGVIDPAHPRPIACWQDKIADLTRRGIRVIVLSPASNSHLQSYRLNQTALIRLSEDSCLRPLRRKTITHTKQHVPSAAAEQLLIMLSIATRVEPSLLRALRHCLPKRNRDAGLEGEVWCHSELDTAATACALAPWAVQTWRKKFNLLPETLQQNSLDYLRRWHAALPQAIHHEETLVWQHATSTPIMPDEQIHADDARDFFNNLAAILKTKIGNPDFPSARLVQMADRHVHWAAPLLAGESYLNTLSVVVNEIEPMRGLEGLPRGIDPVAWLQQSQVIETQMMHLIQYPHQRLGLSPAGSPLPAGATRLATLAIDRATLLYASEHHGIQSPYRPWPWQSASTHEILPPELPVQLEVVATPQTHQSRPSFILHTGRKRLQFAALEPPAWATAWGQDQYGLFVELTVRQIVQRFRWIAPGTFLMGSPESEPKRISNETQHKVTLTKGFWLAETAVTQALWQAIMKDNPSRFQENENNPVETISWRNAQDFIKRLNEKYPDLSARLPTEAEWEYACRAGTQTPFSFGDNITPEQANYHGNYPYAGGQKGIHRKKTVAVKSLPPNPWGLYEMHGNVWEWCADWFGEYPEHAVTDPHGPDDGATRVLRGGSWNDDGGFVRSAIRIRLAPVDRNDIIGFRLALG